MPFLFPVYANSCVLSESYENCTNYFKTLKILNYRSIIYPAVRLMDVNEVKLFYGHYQERTVSEERMSDPNEYLWWISHQCRGMSGRSLRKLGFLAHASFIGRPKVDCQTFLGALSKTIQSEQRNRVQRPSTSSSLAIMS